MKNASSPNAPNEKQLRYNKKSATFANAALFLLNFL
jgi:hypothetical protein